MPTIRFQVLLNGRALCIAGMDQPGVVLTNVEADNWAIDYDAKGQPVRRDHVVCRLQVHGLTENDETLHWLDTDFKVGDEISIRVLGEGAFDPPASIESPEAGDY